MSDSNQSASASPASNETILALENVSKFFGKVIALNGVTLRLKRGEVHCLLGDNGAGKSTLIKTLAGVHTPSSGEYLVDGKPVQFGSPKEALDLGIATVYQDLALVPLLSVARNFFMGREPQKKRFGFLNVMDLDLAAETSRARLSEMGINVREPHQRFVHAAQSWQIDGHVHERHDHQERSARHDGGRRRNAANDERTGRRAGLNALTPAPAFHHLQNRIEH